MPEGIRVRVCTRCRMAIGVILTDLGSLLCAACWLEMEKRNDATKRAAP
jgi:hypothetical protein